LHYSIDRDLNAIGYFFYNTFSIKRVNDHSEEKPTFWQEDVVRQQYRLFYNNLFLNYIWSKCQFSSIIFNWYFL